MKEMYPARAAARAIAIACGLVLAACATSRSEEPPVRTKTYLQAEGDLNPDPTGRASPAAAPAALGPNDAWERARPDGPPF